MQSSHTSAVQRDSRVRPQGEAAWSVARCGVAADVRGDEAKGCGMPPFAGGDETHGHTRETAPLVLREISRLAVIRRRVFPRC